MNSSLPYTRGAVVSKDGTTIGYRQLGIGPGVIVVHGGMEASQHLMQLAAVLSDRFTATIPDRRGRGMSGPFGEQYSVSKDCEDIAALVEHTGAERLFGLSSGALIALRSALVLPNLKQVALYEPPLSLNGSSPTSWVTRYDREVAQGKLPQALGTVMKGLQVEPIFAALPRWLLVPLFTGMMRFADDAKEGNVSITSLIPTMHYDMVVVRQTADTLPDYADLAAQVLLLGGSKSPSFLKRSLDALAETLPHVERVTFPGLDHLGPTNDGKPNVVAAELCQFFAEKPL